MPNLPPLRASIDGVGAIAASTARRLACNASVITLLTEKGEPLSIGRKTRVPTPAIHRAVIARDRHCQFARCDCTRHLQLHHLVHWADGGETSVDNLVAVCPFHHRLVHEHGYTVERVPDSQRYSVLDDIEDCDGRQLAVQLGALGRRFRFVRPAKGRHDVSAQSARGDFADNARSERHHGADGTRSGRRERSEVCSCSYDGRAARSRSTRGDCADGSRSTGLDSAGAMP